MFFSYAEDHILNRNKTVQNYRKKSSWDLVSIHL
jgi:hypothetical protein